MCNFRVLETDNKMIFLETAGHKFIKERGGCAVESAAVNTALDIYVLFVVKSINLEDEIICLIYTRYPQVKFYYLDTEQELSGKVEMGHKLWFHNSKLSERNMLTMFQL